MCEPTHSITQYPEDDNTPSGIGPSTALGLKGKLVSWLKKIGSYLHLSRLGSGHTESIEWAQTNDWYLHGETRYEANWWDRAVVVDGAFHGYPKGISPAYRLIMAQEALACATKYAHRVSLGSLSQLRNFLEVSLQQTEQPWKYVEAFMRLLIPAGRDQLSKRLQRQVDKKWTSFAGKKGLADERAVSSLTKTLLGFTRQRGLLVPCWADDAGLWTPPNLVLG